MTLTFTYDDDYDAYVSNEITLAEVVTAHVELVSKAPVVTLKQEADGGWANYGEAPEQSDQYEIKLAADAPCTVKLATPVEVLEAYTF